MMPLRVILDSLLSERLVFFRDNVLGGGTVNTVCLSCSQVIASTYSARNHECAEHVRRHHSPPPEPPTADHGGGTPPAGANPSEDNTPPSEPPGSLGDSGGGELHGEEPIPYRLSDAERENIALRRRVAELERELELDLDNLLSWSERTCAEQGKLNQRNAELARRLAEAHEDIGELGGVLTRQRDELEQAELAAKVLADELESERAKVAELELLPKTIEDIADDTLGLQPPGIPTSELLSKLEREIHEQRIRANRLERERDSALRWAYQLESERNANRIELVAKLESDLAVERANVRELERKLSQGVTVVRHRLIF